jgi:Fe-Mn family superoxide dismutase
MQGFTEQMLQIHFKLYEGYVKNTNDLLGKLQAMSDSGKEGSFEYGALKRRLGWEFDGMRLHELYFGNLGGAGAPDPKSPLYLKIVDQFGSFDRWKKDFIATGLIRGIGWAVLYFDPMQKRLVNTWINEHDVGHLAGSSPILIMDVFEHAYITEYGLDRAKYIDAFFKNIDWGVVQSRL